MKSFAIDLDILQTVAAAVVDAGGILREANPGFLRLLPPGDASPIGTRVARNFIQPNFASLAAAPAGEDGYRGLLTIGDAFGKVRTLRGQVRRVPQGIHVLAEYDVDELERLQEAMLDLQRESSDANHALASANLTLKQREVRIVETSLTDALTGVGNRRKLDLALAAEIDRAVATGGLLSVIMADVDHFKRVNDEFGHGAGDAVLARMGALLLSQTRATDTVARFGGEEFVVLMPNASLAQAAAKAERLRAALSGLLIEPLSKPVTSSFGVAQLSRGESAEAFLGRADAALYRAKAGGRNRVDLSVESLTRDP